MSSVGSEPALIGIDWGTSSLRAFLISGDGQVLYCASSSQGIMHVADKDFDAVFDGIMETLIGGKALPVLASGMITSRNGWVETPYVQVPAGADQLARSLVFHQTKSGATIHFITGTTIEHLGRPDVMRGEETQIVGASSLGLADGVFVMPGTHSKWVHVCAGRIENFNTYMTGEVFAALKGHTILGRLMENGSFNAESFGQGVAAALDPGANLLHDLFHVRTLPLMGKIAGTVTADYLSGLLIGTEIAAATRGLTRTERITIVGRDDLSERYEIGLLAAGLQSRRAPDDIVAKGHFLIARAAGILE